MPTFHDIVTGEEEDLTKLFYSFRGKENLEDNKNNLATAATKFKLKLEKLILALGFNPHIKRLEWILTVLGYANLEELAKERNEIYINDVYQHLSLENILILYSTIKNESKMLQVMQYLLQHRLKNIEDRIESTVDYLTIEKYKVEVKAIYADKIVDIDFAEERLNKTRSGFRALLNEACLITESKLIPIGDIFFREMILPEEKRKLLSKNMIPIELVESRLKEKNTSQQERQILNDFLALHRKNKTTETTN